VVAICMQDSSQGQVETSLHFLNICFALDVPQVLEKQWGSTIAFQRPSFCVGVSWEEFLSYWSE